MTSILIISPEAWRTNQVSKHHYARTLAKRGHRVYFLEPPTHSRTSISVESLDDEVGDIWVIRAPPVARGLRFMPSFLRRALEARWIDRLERRLKVVIDCVWLFENSRFYDMSCAGDRLKIYHQMDLNQDFHPTEAARSADMTFAVSSVILERLAPYAKSAHKISHGVLDVAAPSDIDYTMIRHGRPSAAYVGNVDSAYLDHELLWNVIRQSPDVDFHIIGGFSGEGQAYRLLQAVPNVFFWGHLPSRELAAALRRLDVTLLVYNTAKYGDQLANPHKMLEYLRSGNVTVATFAQEYAHLAGDLIEMVNDPHEYFAKFREVIANLDRFNADGLRARRAAFAAEYTYDRQLDRIADALNGCRAISDRFGKISL